MRKLFLLLALLSPLSAQQLVVADWGLVEVNPTSVVVPTPDFYHSFNNDSGTGSTATADIGDNCSLLNHNWVEDPVSSGNYEIDFNGGNTTADCGTALDGLTDFSISAWLNPDSFGESVLGSVLNKSGAASNAVSWELRLNDFGGTNGYMEIMICNNSGVAPSNCDRFRTDVDAFVAYIGAGWVQIGASVSGCTSMACSAQLYIDGSPVTTTQFGTDNTGTRRSDGTDTVRTGQLVGGIDDFDGDIDEVKVWAATALDDAQMAAVYVEGR